MECRVVVCLKMSQKPFSNWCVIILFSMGGDIHYTLFMGSINLVTTSNLPSLVRFAFSMNFQGLYSIRRAIPYTGLICTQYPSLSKCLTHAVREAGALRKVRSFLRNSSHAPPSRGRKNGKEKHDSAFQWTNGLTVLGRMEAAILSNTFSTLV